MTVKTIRFLLIGAGNVGRRFLELIALKGDTLHDRLGLRLVLAGVADRSGVAICPAGLDPQGVVKLKLNGQGVAAYPRWGQAGVSALEMVETAQAGLLLEASPVNLQDGTPGLTCIEAALARGMHVVTANKAPLVLAFPRLSALAGANGVQLRYSATVAGGLPAVNLGRRDLAMADIYRLEGILNLTSNYILTSMAEHGLSYDQALALTQAAGHAEADPRLDVEGWDAANKLVILAHSVLYYPATLADVAVQGITGLTAETLRQAVVEGKRVKLIAAAERVGEHYRLAVAPTWLDLSHPLAQLGAEQMGIVYHTDVCGVLSAAIVEETPMPTAAAMLRDIIEACL
ncbi:MAG: homoserine dehydrogenase [Anaerolineae bacterium]|nr:homoserine dehydrogenase [Anaerolineae bacterium]